MPRRPPRDRLDIGNDVMVLTMTSSGPPPLPSRGTTSNGKHVPIGLAPHSTVQQRQLNHPDGRGQTPTGRSMPVDMQSHRPNVTGRSQSTDNPPPVPPMNFPRRQSDTSVVSNRNAPQLPARNPGMHTSSTENNVMNRKSIETKSFVNRNTARLFSDPDARTADDMRSQLHGKTLPRNMKQASSASPKDLHTTPTLPPTNTIPRARGSSSLHNISDVYDANSPPSPPTSLPPRNSKSATQETTPSRPRKTSVTSPDTPPSGPRKTSITGPVTEDFEKKFFFHPSNDFPSPEPINENQKTYPSKSAPSVRRPDPHQQQVVPAKPLGYM